MVSTRKKKPQNKRLFSQLSESDADFMTGESNHEAQASNRFNAIDEGTSSNKITDLVQVNSPQVDMRTLEENIVSKVRSEMDNVMTSIETRVQNGYYS